MINQNKVGQNSDKTKKKVFREATGDQGKHASAKSVQGSVTMQQMRHFGYYKKFDSVS